MVKSITFTGEFGYITEKIQEPKLGIRMYEYRKKQKNLSDVEKEMEKTWKKEHKEWKKHKDEYNNPILVKNLLGRKIEFSPDKVNVIFGPNASGKTTIIKAIAGNAGVSEDGYSHLLTPPAFGFGHTKEKEITEMFKKLRETDMMKNSADIEWDGTPIYYDKFSEREYRGFGDLSGTILNGVGEEVMYNLNKSRVSLGQNSIFLINKLSEIAKKPVSFKTIFSKYVNEDGSLKKFRCNDVWEMCYKAQLRYYLGLENSMVDKPATFLFDELDKSLDIENLYALYTSFLPTLQEKTGIQIIIISHSPLVLSEKIGFSDKYNLISTDEEYTQRCVSKIKELF